jgi:hypothetical protein
MNNSPSPRPSPQGEGEAFERKSLLFEARDYSDAAGLSFPNLKFKTQNLKLIYELQTSR